MNNALNPTSIEFPLLTTRLWWALFSFIEKYIHKTDNGSDLKWLSTWKVPGCPGNPSQDLSSAPLFSRINSGRCHSGASNHTRDCMYRPEHTPIQNMHGDQKHNLTWFSNELCGRFFYSEICYWSTRHFLQYSMLWHGSFDGALLHSGVNWTEMCMMCVRYVLSDEMVAGLFAAWEVEIAHWISFSFYILVCIIGIMQCHGAAKWIIIIQCLHNVLCIPIW